MWKKGTIVKDRWSEERKRVTDSASYQTVLEEGCRRCPWVTAQRWRARRLCCQSKARGRWVSGRTAEEKRNRKYITHHKPPKSWWTHAFFKDLDNRGFVVTVLVCVSNIHRGIKKRTFPFPVETQTDLQAQIGSPPPHSQNPQLRTILWQCRLDIKWRRWEQRFVSVVLLVHSRRRRLPDTPDSLIPISAVYQQLIHMWGMSFPPVNTGRICCRSSRTIFMGLPRRRIWRTPPPSPAYR